MLYIFIFLHQTTTFRMQWQYQVRCISLYSYIKPQHRPSNWFKICGCISLYSYIKPQLAGVLLGVLTKLTRSKLDFD